MTATIGRHGLLNLDNDDLARVRRLGVRAAMLGVHNAASIHYTQGPERWYGISRHCRSYKGQYPHFADCSAFVTWILWDATRRYAAADKDFVNGMEWKAGHTGTLVQHGREIPMSDLRMLDLVFYGDEGWRPGHVAIYVGAGRVVSFGSDPGPFLLPVRYRRDTAVGGWLPRRYIH